MLQWFWILVLPTGDFIKGVEHIYKTATALQDTSGADQQAQQVAPELENLAAVVLRVRLSYRPIGRDQEVEREGFSEAPSVDAWERCYELDPSQINTTWHADRAIRNPCTGVDARSRQQATAAIRVRSPSVLALRATLAELPEGLDPLEPVLRRGGQQALIRSFKVDKLTLSQAYTTAAPTRCLYPSAKSQSRSQLRQPRHRIRRHYSSPAPSRPSSRPD